MPVLTPGLLPPWHPEWVFRAVDLGELSRSWPYDARRLAVNHGTAFAVLLDAGPRRSKAWQRADARSGAARAGELLTDAAGPLHGPLAHGLALGAHLAVNNGIVWNRLGAVYRDYATDRARLRSPWGIQHRADVRDRLDSLMKYRLVGRVQEGVLRARHTLALRLERPPTRAEWTEAVERAFAARDAGDRAEAHRALHRFTRYEDRFRADGVLAPDRRIDTLAAFDLGRAVNVVRLALGARLSDPLGAEQDVLRLSEPAAPTPPGPTSPSVTPSPAWSTGTTRTERPARSRCTSSRWRGTASSPRTPPAPTGTSPGHESAPALPRLPGHQRPGSVGARPLGSAVRDRAAPPRGRVARRRPGSTGRTGRCRAVHPGSARRGGREPGHRGLA